MNGHVRQAVIVIAWSALLATTGTTFAEGAYTFTSGIPGDGFDWPPSSEGLLPDDYFDTPDGHWFLNGTFNNVFFDQQYQAAGNAAGISAEACWGNPRPDTSPDQWPSALGIELYDAPPGTLQFNFAWTASQGAVGIYVEDTYGSSQSVSVTLPGLFDTGPVFGHTLGHEALVGLDAAALGLMDIGYVEIDLDPVATLGGTEEFAIDNFAWDQPPPPVNTSQLYPGDAPGWLVGTGSESILPSPFGDSITLTAKVRNYTDDPGDATDDTTYSVTITGPFTDPGGQTNVPIAAGQLINDGIRAEFDLNQPSGEHRGQAILHNDLNPDDPDNVVELGWDLWDQVDLSNNDELRDPRWGEQLWITNAAAGPHVGALRASARITDIEILEAPIELIGFDIGTIIDPNETITAVVNARGLLNGSYFPRAMVHMEMVKPDGSDIPFAYAHWVPPPGWNFFFVVGDQTAGNWQCNTGDSFGDLTAGVNTAVTAATIVDGVSSSDQTVSMQFVANPEAGGTFSVPILGEVLDLSFSAGEPIDPYALQFTYRDEDVPIGFDEADLRIYTFDVPADQWIEAVLGNSDGGLGATFHPGSYDAYQASLGGGPPMPGAFGVDVDGNRLWAVLDHASLFGTGAIPEPASVLVLALGAALVLRRRG